MSSFKYTRFFSPLPANPRAEDSASIRALVTNRLATGNVLSHPLLDGVLIQGIVLPNSPLTVTIEHRLGRAWIGWFETSRTVNNATSNTIRQIDDVDRKHFIKLDATNPITIDIWVF